MVRTLFVYQMVIHGYHGYAQSSAPVFTSLQPAGTIPDLQTLPLAPSGPVGWIRRRWRTKESLKCGPEWLNAEFAAPLRTKCVGICPSPLPASGAYWCRKASPVACVACATSRSAAEEAGCR